jgi:hypothetical protein
MRQLHVAALALSLSIVAQSAYGQTCTGQVAIGSGNPALVAGSASFTEGARAFDVGVTAGSSSIFGGFTVGRATSTVSDYSSTFYGGVVGVQVPARRAMICPMFSVSHSKGQGDDDSSTSFAGGAAAGFVVSETDTLSVVPTVGFSISKTRQFDAFGDASGIVQFGVGFIINKRFSVTPSVVVPVGIEGAKPIVAVVAALGFGGS